MKNSTIISLIFIAFLAVGLVSFGVYYFITHSEKFLVTNSGVGGIAPISGQATGTDETHYVSFSGSDLGLNEFEEPSGIVGLLLNQADWETKSKNQYTGSVGITFPYNLDKEPTYLANGIIFSGNTKVGDKNINYKLKDIQVDETYADVYDRTYPMSQVSGMGNFEYSTSLEVTRSVPVEWFLDTGQDVLSIRGRTDEGQLIADFRTGEFSSQIQCYDNDNKCCQLWGMNRAGYTGRSNMLINDKFKVSNLKLDDFNDIDNLVFGSGAVVSESINNIDMSVLATSDSCQSFDRVMSKSYKGFNGKLTFSNGIIVSYKLTNLKLDNEDLDTDSIETVFSPKDISVDGTGVFTYTMKVNINEVYPVEFYMDTGGNDGRVEVWNKELGLDVRFETPSESQRKGTILYKSAYCKGCN